MTKREDLRLQGDTGSKTGGDQSEKGNKKRAHRDTTRISRMIRTSAFSARTEFSVTTTICHSERPRRNDVLGPWSGRQQINSSLHKNTAVLATSSSIVY